jgi:hypothetical protein
VVLKSHILIVQSKDALINLSLDNFLTHTTDSEWPTNFLVDSFDSRSQNLIVSSSDPLNIS